MMFVCRSVTINWVPSGVNWICDGPAAAPPIRGLREPSTGVSEPSSPMWKPEIEPSVALTAYRRLPCTVRLTGRTPPVATRLTSRSRSPSMAREETSLLPESTPNRNRWSSPAISEPCETSGSEVSSRS